MDYLTTKCNLDLKPPPGYTWSHTKTLIKQPMFSHLDFNFFLHASPLHCALLPVLHYKSHDIKHNCEFNNMYHSFAVLKTNKKGIGSANTNYKIQDLQFLFLTQHHPSDPPLLQNSLQYQVPYLTVIYIIIIYNVLQSSFSTCLLSLI